MTTPTNQTQRNSLSEKVTFLSRPAAYDPPPACVQTRETHMSWLFFAGERVYKLKKPVKYSYLDFSTLAARERNCRTEIRLNRRLAPDVYLGIARLTRGPSGRLALDGEGETIDWLVVMRRLSHERMLDGMIARGAAGLEEINHVAALLAEFYRDLEPVSLAPEWYIARFACQQGINREILKNERFSLRGEFLDRVLSGIDAVIESEPELLAVRVREGHIIEGHGDLRPEHVCLSEPPVIIDCLEFNRELRLVDPFDELADLAMECGRLGAPWIGDILIGRCAETLANRPGERLLAFYTAYRACLRARLAVRHLLDAESREPEKWLPLAREYLEIAGRACLSLPPQADQPANRSRGNAG